MVSRLATRATASRKRKSGGGWCVAPRFRFRGARGKFERCNALGSLAAGEEGGRPGRTRGHANRGRHRENGPNLAPRPAHPPHRPRPRRTRARASHSAEYFVAPKPHSCNRARFLSCPDEGSIAQLSSGSGSINTTGAEERLGSSSMSSSWLQLSHFAGFMVPLPYCIGLKKRKWMTDLILLLI